jgi:hypothetical protein
MRLFAAFVCASYHGSASAQVPSWRAVQPAARMGHAMAYDSERDRVVVFGGGVSGCGAADFGDTWEWNGSAWALVATGGPSQRRWPSMAYDSARRRVVLFGGCNGSECSDTWEWDGWVWVQKAVSGPPSRGGHCMAYDSQRRRIVLFGGARGSGSELTGLGDTWEWDGERWVLCSSSGPAPRYFHAMAYDESRKRVLLFGGVDNTNMMFSDTWEWDGASWRQLQATGPSPRAGHSLVYDAARRRVVMYGGGDSQSALDELWEWNGVAWTARAAAGPTPRYCHRAVYDFARQSIVMFGGYNVGERIPAMADTWEWDGSSWAKRNGLGPTARKDHALASDTVRFRITAFGGSVCGRPVGDTYEWDGLTWLLRSTTGPSPRSSHAMAYDVTRRRTTLFGGVGPGKSFSGETWVWDGSGWTLASTTGPSPRCQHAMSYDISRGKLVLFGGTDYQSRFDDTWEWSGTAWTLRTTGGPPSRSGHAMAYDAARKRTVLYGGAHWDGGFATDLGDTWEWDGTVWSLRSHSGPQPGTGCRMAYDASRNRVVLFSAGQTWEWNGTVWSQTAVMGPSLRSGTALAYDPVRRSVLLFGGDVRDGDDTEIGYADDLWEYGVFASPFTLGDAAKALRAATGRTTVTKSQIERLNIVSTGVSATRVDLLDAVRIARKVAGLERNP